MRHLIAILTCLVVPTVSGFAQARVDKNVVYGMYSGLALLMDVHYPEKSNGYGIVFVAGRGGQAPLAYDAVGLKESHGPMWGHR
jgi:hypothetical protein